MVYIHPSDQEIREKVRGLSCRPEGERSRSSLQHPQPWGRVVPVPWHRSQRPEPPQTVQGTGRVNRSPFLWITRIPVPLHLWQRPEPLQKGQGVASSPIVVPESSEAGRLGMAGDQVQAGRTSRCNRIPALPPEGILRSVAPELNQRPRTSCDLFPAPWFARHVSPLTTTISTHPTAKDVSIGFANGAVDPTE